MKSFKDIIAEDVLRTFLNTEEFSDVHTINGTEMPAQVDVNELIEREKRMGQDADGLYSNQKILYVAASHFGAMPKRGSILRLDGRTYRVLDSVDEYGIYSITIEANRA